MLFVIPHFSDSFMNIINFSHSLKKVTLLKTHYWKVHYYTEVTEIYSSYFSGIPSIYFVIYVEDLIP